MTINYQMLHRRKYLFDKKLLNLASNFVLRRAKMTLGNSKQNCSWQYRTISKFEVLKSFIKKRLITKSSEFSSALLSGQASSPYNNIGTHLECIILRTTSSETNIPLLGTAMKLTGFAQQFLEVLFVCVQFAEQFFDRL